MSEQPKVGLVLSGGGAKGAYQVGIVRALSEMGAQVDLIAGASIGALNGGILASAPSLAVGAERLEKLWASLTQDSPMAINKMVYLQLLVIAASVMTPHVRLLKLLGLAANLSSNDALLSDTPLKNLMEQYLDTTALKNGLPLYVSVYPSLGGATDILRCVAAATGLRDTPDSEFLHVQSLTEENQRNVLMASAALPILFEARKIGDQKYTDGGQGGWSKAQGNTPIQPLIDAGCNMVIVTHLGDGSLWSRHDFPDTTVLEVRPQQSMARADGALGGFRDLLGFDASKIPSWVEQGYEDALRCLGRVKEAMEVRNQLSTSRQAVTESEKRGKGPDADLAQIMKRL